MKNLLVVLVVVGLFVGCQQEAQEEVMEKGYQESSEKYTELGLEYYRAVCPSLPTVIDLSKDFCEFPEFDLKKVDNHFACVIRFEKWLADGSGDSHEFEQRVF